MSPRLTSRVVLAILADGKVHLTRALADSLSAPNTSVASMCRCLKRQGLITSLEGLHSITPLGRDVLSGDVEPCKGKASQSTRGLRHRAWQAMQMLTFFTVDSLLEIVATGEEKNAAKNLNNYLVSLHKAGFIVRSKVGKYLLKEAAKGPHAPSYNRAEKTVTDRNRGTVFHV